MNAGFLVHDPAYWAHFSEDPSWSSREMARCLETVYKHLGVDPYAQGKKIVEKTTGTFLAACEAEGFTRSPALLHTLPRRQQPARPGAAAAVEPCCTAGLTFNTMGEGRRRSAGDLLLSQRQLDEARRPGRRRARSAVTSDLDQRLTVLHKTQALRIIWANASDPK